MNKKRCCNASCDELRHASHSYCHVHYNDRQREFAQRPEQKQYRKEYMSEYTKRPEHRKRKRELRQSQLEQCYLVLGDRCIICGYQGDALQIDHVHGNVDKEDTYLARANVAKGNAIDYQLLCANCNWERRFTVEEQALHFLGS